MHISFMVPTWLLIGMGTIAYPSIGAVIASFLMRASNRRLPGLAVAASGILWPVTLALGSVAFPLWLVTWFMSNYGEAIKRSLQGKMFQGSGEASTVGGNTFMLNEQVTMVRTFGQLALGVYGHVRDQKGSELFVDFPSIGSHWVPASYVRKA